ncbi:MAG TPA: hypothetical protein DCY88_24910 [Cyanobacteria bacterium UBA11372]|nr:hypothetical protein [Cyanobacteria bacterium UBA11372]
MSQDKPHKSKIAEVKIGNHTVGFYQIKHGSKNRGITASVTVQQQRRCAYVGTTLPSEDILIDFAKSMVLPSRTEWLNRPKKRECRPKKADQPSPKTFPPEQYPHLYAPGTVEKIQLRRTIGECRLLQEKVKELTAQLRGSVLQTEKLIEQVKALEIAGDMQAAQIRQLTHERTELLARLNQAL